MNETNKTSSFLKAINKYAQQQSEAIRLEVEEFKKQEIEKATNEAIGDAYKLIQKEISIKKSQIISEYARKEQNSRQQLFVKRNEIVDKVFEDARVKLDEYTKTDAYKNYIKKSATEMAELFENNECIVYLREADKDYLDIISSILKNCTIEFDETIKLGGIKGYCKAMSIMADDTFDTKLDDQRVWFAENSKLKVV